MVNIVQEQTHIISRFEIIQMKSHQFLSLTEFFNRFGTEHKKWGNAVILITILIYYFYTISIDIANLKTSQGGDGHAYLKSLCAKHSLCFSSSTQASH